ncbi:MAG: sulfite exporter TauE/SafE family protein [Luteolibacter sp.]
MNFLALLGAVAIGLSLGLTGAGGSILTLPVLVYLADVPPRQAVGLSLLIVGAAALAGAWQRARVGDLHLKAASMFVISGMLGAVGGSRLTHLVTPSVLMTIFAILMAVIGASMLIPRKNVLQPAPECHPLRCLLAGGAVGVITGFIGVGGGFLLVPALVKFARLPLRTATGTSLAIIACNSAAGFLSHLGEAPVPWLLAAVFATIAAAGVLVGGKIVSRLPEAALRRAFALLVLATATFVLWRR